MSGLRQQALGARGDSLTSDLSRRVDDTFLEFLAGSRNTIFPHVDLLVLDDRTVGIAITVRLGAIDFSAKLILPDVCVDGLGEVERCHDEYDVLSGR